MKITVREAKAEYCINCGQPVGKYPERAGTCTFCSQRCMYDFIEHEDIVSDGKPEAISRHAARKSTQKSVAKKNERGDRSDELNGPACLCVSAGATCFDCSCDGDDAMGNVAISPEDIEKAVAKTIDPKLWGAVKADFDWNLLREIINDFAMEVGSVSGYSWYSPSQYFEDPGDGGYEVTLDLFDEALSTAIDTLLYTLGQLVLDALAGEAKYIDYGEDDEEKMIAAAKEDAEIQARLQDLGLDFNVIRQLFELPNSQSAQDIFEILWALDGSTDSN